jgi:hypothetical protein
MAVEHGLKQTCEAVGYVGGRAIACCGKDLGSTPI